MSRAINKGQAALKVPTGDLAAVSIGMETLVLPRAVAHKLLPLLEKGLLANRGYVSISRRDDYVVHSACQPEYTAIQAGHVRVATAEEQEVERG